MIHPHLINRERTQGARKKNRQAHFFCGELSLGFIRAHPRHPQLNSFFDR
jgi:hypothetical protein